MKTNLAVIILVSIFLCSCGKKDNIKNENQSSAQNVANEQKLNEQKEINKKWTGQYSFEESAPGVTGESSQSWSYSVSVSQANDTLLLAVIKIDGYQTMTRLEAEVKAAGSSAEFIFLKYGKENIFEPYKKGEKLFSFVMNEKNELITNWDKMKPNVISNQTGGKIMFQKVPA
jgi:hypothetical protein